nr:ribonuclease H-like domain-containing protein [Tanacetum cinerariifolium]
MIPTRETVLPSTFSTMTIQDPTWKMDTLYDFLNRHILFRCDSSGDLYPVTQPSLTPHALLSVSPSTWNQCLGHLNDDVLRSLMSRQLISYNKEKSSHLCHACQLGKHSHSVALSDPNWRDAIYDEYNALIKNSTWVLVPKPPNVNVSPSVALSDPNWRDAIYDEYNALIKNSTWVLVPKPPNVNVVRSMWLFRHKHHADGSLSRYKAHLVANGRSQQFGVDYDDTFSLVVKPTTIRTVLSLALSQNWHIHQLDVKNAFLNGDFSDTVYMYQPSVDDIVLTKSSTDLHQRIISSLHKEFDMTDLGALNYFLRISITRDSTCKFLSQKKYAMELLDMAHMDNCNPTRTPVDTESKLGSDEDLISDATLYRSLAGSLIAYIDADWAGCPATRRSTFGYCVFLGDNLLLWLAKRQHTLSTSSAKAEYRGVANVVAKTTWLRNLLRELHTPFLSATLIYCDNKKKTYSVFHKTTPCWEVERVREKEVWHVNDDPIYYHYMIPGTEK